MSDYDQQFIEIVKRVVSDLSKAHGSRIGIVIVAAPLDVDLEGVEIKYGFNVEREHGIFMLQKVFAKWQS